MKNISWLTTLILVLISLSSCKPSGREHKYDSFLAVGTYTSKSSEGIYIYKFNTESADFELVSTYKLDNPSYLSFSADERVMYAVTENNDVKSDCITALSFNNDTGKLTFLDQKNVGGAAPCYILVDNFLNKAITANYMGGNIAVFDILESGKLSPEGIVKSFDSLLGPNKDRQEQSHLHCVYLSPDKKFLYANDLGADCIYKFNLSNEESLLSEETIKLAPGSGPRHTVFHPNNKWAYTLTELSGEVMAFEYNNGDLQLFQTILVDPQQAAGSGDIQITPDGKFLYASNRLKEDGVAILSIADNGELSYKGYQKTGVHPRNMVITPNGKLLLVACRDNDNIEMYTIDSKSGLLTNTGKTIEVSMPVCLKFAKLNN